MYLVFYLVLIGQITSLLLSLCLTGLKEIRILQRCIYG
jgi:hypothetical protein